MLSFFRKLFRKERPVITLSDGREIEGTGDGYLDSLVIQSLEASLSRMYSWEFAPGTMTLDPETATFEDLDAAIQDCNACTATEYPETEEGTYAAMDRRAVLREAMCRRFPDIAEKTLWDQHRQAMRRAVRAHGGPLPAWVNQEHPPQGRLN